MVIPVLFLPDILCLQVTLNVEKNLGYYVYNYGVGNRLLCPLGLLLSNLCYLNLLDKVLYLWWYFCMASCSAGISIVVVAHFILLKVCQDFYFTDITPVHQGPFA